MSIEATTLRAPTRLAPTRRAPAPAPTTVERRSGVATALRAFALSRLVVLAAAVPALFQHDPGGGPWPYLPGATKLAAVLSRWDGAWYVMVAGRGYPDRTLLDNHLSDVAFHPAYPALVRVTASVTRLSLPAAAVLVSTALGALSAVLVWHLAARLRDADVADRAVLLYVLFPGAFVLSMAYAEALMLTATIGALLLVLQRRWVLAGLVAAVATAARPNALAIVAALGVAAIVEIVQRRNLRALAAPALGMTGVIGYYAYLGIHSGDAMAWFRSEREMWHDRPSLFTPIIHHLTGLWGHMPSLAPGGLNGLVITIGLVIVAAGAVLLWQSRLPLAVKVYTAAALLVPLTSATVGPRPRMLLAAFPLAILAAERLPRRAFQAAAVASALGLVAITVITTTTLAAVP